MSAEETWIAVALARDIEPETVTGLRIAGSEQALWRDAAGTIRICPDRCPHRGMRLSFGCVRGELLACLYHGWQFDGSGACRSIPAHPDLIVPPTIGLDFHVAEQRLGMVFVPLAPDGMGGPLPGEAPVVPVRSLMIEAPAALVGHILGETGAVFAPPLAHVPLPGGPLVVALQPVAERETCLHAVLAGEAGASAPALRLAAARWLEALRDDAERAAASGRAA